MSKSKNFQPKSLQQQTKKKLSQWKPCMVFIVFVFILYANTLNHYFVLDDEVVITMNSFTQKGIKGIPEIFKYDTFVGNMQYIYHHNGEMKTADQVQEEMKYVSGGRYRPFSLATFALEIQLFGEKNSYPNTQYKFIGNAFMSHLNNILLYLFTVCLLYLILFRLFPPKKDTQWYLSLPFIASMLFLAHPIHTEVVANIKGRDEILALLGSLATLWFSINYFDTHKKIHLLWAGLCLFLALLSKENAITFLALIPISLYYFVIPNLSTADQNSLTSQKKRSALWISMFPLIIASVVFLIIRSTVLGSMNSPAPITELMNNPFVNATKGEMLATIFFTLFIYVKLLFFPHPLTWDYYPFHIEIVNWSNPITILSLLFYLIITSYAIYGFFKKKDIISYSIWLYLLPLLIVSNLFFPIGVFMSERFLFFSSIGFAIFIGWLIMYIPNFRRVHFTGIVLIVILSLFSIKTVSRNKAWKNNFTLYSTDIKTSKNSAKGNYLLAYELALRAVQPSNTTEMQNKMQSCEQAIKHLSEAVKLYPNYSDAFELLGKLYFDAYKDVAKSLHYLSMALQNNNSREYAILSSVKHILATTLINFNLITSTPLEIIQSCDKFLKIKPDMGELYYIKGVLYSKYLNDNELSLVNFEKALTYDFPKTAIFYENVGSVYAYCGNYNAALKYLQKAVELGAINYGTYMNLGKVYQIIGDVNNANLYMSKGYEMIQNTKQKE